MHHISDCIVLPWVYSAIAGPVDAAIDFIHETFVLGGKVGLYETQQGMAPRKVQIGIDNYYCLYLDVLQ